MFKFASFMVGSRVNDRESPKVNWYVAKYIVVCIVSCQNVSCCARFNDYAIVLCSGSS